MFKKQNITFLAILTHPFFLGLLIWLLVIFLFRPDFNKYEIEHVRDFDSKSNSYFYEDIDSDQVSEAIRLDTNDSMLIKVLVHEGMHIDEQFNLHYRLAEGDYLQTGDYDYDGYSEVYIFTQNEDSIFLNILTPSLEEPFIITNRFLAKKQKHAYSSDNPIVIKIGLSKTANSENKDLFFGLNAGFSRKPRNIYRYMIDDDSLLVSPESGASIGQTGFIDLEEDSFQEVCVSTRATGNYGKDAPFSDQFCWLMILDAELDFKFPPIKYGKYPSNLWVKPLYDNDIPYMAAFYDYIGTGNDSSSLLLIDKKGEILRKKDLDRNMFFSARLIEGLHDRPENAYLYVPHSGELYSFSADFNLKKEAQAPRIPINSSIESFDIDDNGEKEIIFLAPKDKMFILDSQMDHLAVYSYRDHLVSPKMSFLRQGEDNNLIYLQFKNYGQFLEWNENLLYSFRVILLILLWICISLLLFLIFRIQQYRANIAREQEKKITSLQLLAIKNQVDPHFTFNIINAMGGLYLSETDKDTAYRIFVEYAGLLRKMIMNSDKVSSTLSEELEFVKSYIEIEKMRKDIPFRHFVRIDPDVNISARIPRMLIFTFVENAMKYGIRSETHKHSFLNIEITTRKKQIKIIIDNSGPALGKIPAGKKGTGRGLIILQEIIDLYERLEKKKISFSMKDRMEESGEVSGVTAEVLVEI